MRTHSKHVRMPILVATIAVLGFGAGCREALFGLDTTMPLAQAEYEYFAPVKARACVELVVIIPLQLDSSFALAKQRALDLSAGADGMIDVAVDREWIWIPPFYYRSCTIVTGRPFRFVARNESADPSDEPTATGDEPAPAPDPEPRADDPPGSDADPNDTTAPETSPGGP